MVKVLASFLLLFLLLNCSTSLEQVSTSCPQRTCNGTTGVRSRRHPPQQLHQQDLVAINDLLRLLPTPSSVADGKFSASRFRAANFSIKDCNTRTNVYVRCDCNKITNICRLTEIDLSDSNLSGQIPATIGKLAYLKALDLSSNHLSGPIPNSFVNLSQLSTVDLSENNLEGPIPRFLTQMKPLSTLYLDDNWFNESIPYEFGTSPSLELLDLSFNFLSESIPHELGNISSLLALWLDDNELSGQFPHQLGNLNNLQLLTLANNVLVGTLPPSFEKLRNLQNFDIEGNNFNGTIPEFISKWKDLETLILCGNNFEGPIPNAISELTKISILAIHDLDGGGKEQLFPTIQNMVSIETLSLRNCSLTGPIPSYIWKFRDIKYLDLSFNSLTGGISSDVNPSAEFIFLKRNKLNESLPRWLWLKNSSTSLVDISENSFTNVTIPRDAISPNKSLFACCSNISNKEKWLDTNYTCDNNSPTNDHLYINCGGNSISINGSNYEADIAPDGGATFFLSNNKTWAYSSMGRFEYADINQYILNKTCNISIVDAPLYMNARISPISLKYYGFCLKNDDYIVRLHFAEIGWDTTRDPGIKRNRVFDVDIQGMKKLRDFNIEEEARGVNKDITKEFNNISVNNNRLEIHLYWSCKGSTSSKTVYYGPLISAISVFPVPVIASVPKEHQKLSSISIVGIAGFATVTVILILAIFWKLGWLGGKTNKGEELKGIELFPGGVFNFQQIKAATQNFDPENKIGEGGFGVVYKGVLPSGTQVAIKKLSTKSKQGAREFLNEISTNYALQHRNLVRLLGCCAEQNELLLVYEYMENNSLEHALFGPVEVKSKLNWLTRVKICRDVAKGLAFLHEESKLKFIHKDIKPTNILLDKDFTAKISDFGYAQLDEEENTRLVTHVAGTKGYMAPEYLQGYLTPKADVYSFGIVTLEIISGKNISAFRPKDQNVYLLDTAYDYQRQQNLIALVDSSLGSDYTYDEALKILNLAMECVGPAPKIRPSMSEVVKVLEGVVKVVESKRKSKVTSTSNPSPVLDDSAMTMSHQFAFSQSTKSGSTSQEGASDTIVCPSTSKEIEDLSNFAD